MTQCHGDNCFWYFFMLLCNLGFFALGVVMSLTFAFVSDIDNFLPVQCDNLMITRWIIAGGILYILDGIAGFIFICRGSFVYGHKPIMIYILIMFNPIIINAWALYARITTSTDCVDAIQLTDSGVWNIVKFLSVLCVIMSGLIIFILPCYCCYCDDLLRQYILTPTSGIVSTPTHSPDTIINIGPSVLTELTEL